MQKVIISATADVHVAYVAISRRHTAVYSQLYSSFTVLLVLLDQKLGVEEDERAGDLLEEGEEVEGGGQVALVVGRLHLRPRHPALAATYDRTSTSPTCN